MADMNVFHLITTPFGTIDLDTVPDEIARKVRSGVKCRGNRWWRFDMRYKASREAAAAMMEIESIAKDRFMEQFDG